MRNIKDFTPSSLLIIPDAGTSIIVIVFDSESDATDFLNDYLLTSDLRIRVLKTAFGVYEFVFTFPQHENYDLKVITTQTDVNTPNYRDLGHVRIEVTCGFIKDGLISANLTTYKLKHNLSFN